MSAHFGLGTETGSEYATNQVWGIAYRFFNEYLFNKYFNYTNDKAKILEEINKLENLINTNE